MPRFSPAARTAIAASLVLLGGSTLIGCTSDSKADSATNETESVDAPASAEAFSDWVDHVGEVTTGCEESSAAVDAALDGTAELEEGEDPYNAALMAAGQGVESCRFALSDANHLTTADTLDELWPEGTALIAEWLTAMSAANQSALVAAAGNLDSRTLVSELYQREREADDLAEQIEALVSTTAESFDLDLPEENLALHRWDPSTH